MPNVRYRWGALHIDEGWVCLWSSEMCVCGGGVGGELVGAGGAAFMELLLPALVTGGAATGCMSQGGAATASMSQGGHCYSQHALGGS